MVTHDKMGHDTRATLLLQCGCRLRVLSGLGNGDLLLDGKARDLLPPPPSIDALVLQAIGFL